jgi:hypothetical protein
LLLAPCALLQDKAESVWSCATDSSLIELACPSTGGVQHISRLIFCASGPQRAAYSTANRRNKKHRFDSRTHCHMCMYLGTKCRLLHTDMHGLRECICACIKGRICLSACIQDPNTGIYMQKCTGYRSAYVHGMLRLSIHILSLIEVWPHQRILHGIPVHLCVRCALGVPWQTVNILWGKGFM